MRIFCPVNGFVLLLSSHLASNGRLPGFLCVNDHQPALSVQEVEAQSEKVFQVQALGWGQA
jgi:hypothetical protein